MVFFTGTLNDANPGVALYNVIESYAISIGFTLVDTVVIGANTHKVLKSSAANNARNLDWYLDINFPTTGTSGGIRFCPFEGYTVATHVALRGPFGGTASVGLDTTTFSKYGGSTFALESQWTNSTNNSALSVGLTTASFAYFISLTNNKISVILSNDAAKIAYGGFFIPTAEHIAYAGSQLFPLIMACIVGGNAYSNGNLNGVTMAPTRVPRYPSTLDWQNCCSSYPIYPVIGGIIGANNASGTNDKVICPQPVNFGSSNPADNRSSFVGYFDGIAHGWASGVVRGDTVTVGSDLWYASSPSSNISGFMKAL